MKKKIETKIEEIIDFIIQKPASEVTIDDYTILKNELITIRSVESKADTGKRMAELLAMVNTHDAY